MNSNANIKVRGKHGNDTIVIGNGQSKSNSNYILFHQYNFAIFQLAIIKTHGSKKARGETIICFNNNRRITSIINRLISFNLNFLTKIFSK